jgi:hypothetical protein
MVIKTVPGAIPVRTRVRRYPSPQREFLKSYTAALIRNVHAIRDPQSAWCSAALLVPKPGPSQYRFTVDVRPVNRVTIPQVWPMPHLESEIGRVAGSKAVATFYLSNRYW